MSSSYRARLERLEAESQPAGAVKVIGVPDSLMGDPATRAWAIERAKEAQGVKVGPSDLLVIIRDFTRTPLGFEPENQVV